MISRVAAWIRAAEPVAVLTGAGISAESGVPVFRGPGGLWRQFRPEELATPAAFRRQPELVWEWYLWRRGKIANAQPNPGHDAIARLQRRAQGDQGDQGKLPDLPVLTLLAVYPVAGLPQLARRRGVRVVEINVEETPRSVDVDAVLRGPAGEILPAVERAL